MSSNYMSVKFIKQITSEGERKVLNIPKKYDSELPIGTKMLIKKFNAEEMTKEELEELLK